MLFANLLASPWRWVLLGVAIIAAIAFGAQGLNYASTWWARRGTARQVDASQAAADARAAAEPHHQHHFDSTVYVLAGQHRELLRTLAKIKHADDSLTRSLPAAPALPAAPPRQ